MIPDEIDDKDDGTPDEEDNNCESLMGKEEETSTLPQSIQITSQLEKIPVKAKQEIRVRVHVLQVVNINLAHRPSPWRLAGFHTGAQRVFEVPE